jgi:formylglycine-generating enzyme required for sulfatase activity
MRAWLIPLLALAGCAHTNQSAEKRPLQDCAWCPELTVVPAGQFQMGSTKGEEGRPEGPVHPVTVRQAFALASTETTNALFDRFVRTTNYQVPLGCEVWPTGSAPNEKANWREPYYGRPIRPEEPVVCVSWKDAQAFISWLSQATGQRYRLPTEAEWEYAARAGSSTDFPWGDNAEDGCTKANMYDASGGDQFRWVSTKCSDAFPKVAPAKSFPANKFGLYNMVGNVWEWTQDCYVIPYPDRADERAVEPPAGQPCARRTVRGGSWMTRPDRNRTSFRGRDPEDTRFFMFGFRVARDLTAEERKRWAK